MSRPAPALRRRTKILLVLVIILVLLMILFAFNPLHPIRWAHDFVHEFKAGWHDGRLAKARRQAQQAP